MAESGEGNKIKLFVKTSKDRKSLEVDQDASVESVSVCAFFHHITLG